MRGLLFLAACALAVDLNFVPLSSFSAKFNSSSATASYISNYDSISGDCSTYSSTYPYVTFNYTFATAGVRFINAVNTYAVHVASGGYNISDLCQNTTGTVWPLDQSSGNPYATDVKQYGHYFEANVSYTIIVFGYGTSYATIAELWDTNFNGQLTVSNTSTNSMWMPVEYGTGSSSTTCTQSSTNVFFSTQVISVNTSGLYNIFAVFGQNFHLPSNYQKPSYPRLTVLRGSFVDTNVTSATCATLGSNFIVEAEDSGESAISVLGVQLDANQAYTIVVSATESTDIEAVWQGHYGITVAPTGFGSFSQASTLRPFQRPTRGSCDETCTRDSSNTTGNPYGVYYFTVPQNSLVYIYGSDSYSGSFDFQWYLYNEHNSVGLTGPSTCGFPLQTCIYDVDSITGQIVDTGSATDLTLIVTSWSSSTQYPNANFTVVTVSGPQIGSVFTSRAPTPGSSTAPTSQSVNQTNSTTAPTSKGQTIAPTSRRPTRVGETYAPTPAGAAGVNAGSVSQPCMVGLIASLAVLVKLL